MRLHDVNVLVYAYRGDAPGHAEFRSAFESDILSDAAFAVSELVLSGFLRIVTHPRIFKTPTPLVDALEFVDRVQSQPNAVAVRPGPRHWDIFKYLATQAGAKGNLIPDAYLAALAVESGSEWVTADRDYARFDGLRWRHPFDD